ncbi:hypothetical protein ABV436_000030 [Vibrio parahaemolyticus]|uniref:hypothetical protein n=1 Tax=Vibrio parahaemolyticus TaxID=670 RepID=UPI0003DCF123|nr:hypothetical protein [Vibrio parahaemolyticus]EGQ8292253.1 hypothetical protein [Vibrio parahaemolyticus]EGQ8328454.1 hypothetical protein [Vibrio parahaemolyticus]EGQ8408538.1 hypothetical protein [Vibrio parahaemolyticus]EGQ8777904.1 hypothetical protein [Vibrio parahaemolyticus]EGQ8788020.1 hypothetical protein [Vibrio parahaemolyticus]
MKRNISDDYFVVSENFEYVNYFVNYNDERDFDIFSNGTVSSFKPVDFLCFDFLSTEKITPDFDVHVSNDILLSMDFLDKLKSVYLYKCSIMPASVNGMDYIYIHCGNVIDILDGDDFNFEKLSSIPEEKRGLFKPSEDSMTYLFHKNFIDNVLNGGQLQSSKVISASKWTMDWMLS